MMDDLSVDDMAHECARQNAGDSRIKYKFYYWLAKLLLWAQIWHLRFLMFWHRKKLRAAVENNDL